MATTTVFKALEKQICAIHEKNTANRYKPENLKNILIKLEACFNAAAVEGVKKKCGVRIDLSNKIGAGVIDIKNALNVKEGQYEISNSSKELAKTSFREELPHVAEYINDYRFKAVQKKLRHIFNTKTAHEYPAQELREDFRGLEECFNDAKANKWRDGFFGELHSAIFYVADEITIQEPMTKHPLRLLNNVLNEIDHPRHEHR